MVAQTGPPWNGAAMETEPPSQCPVCEGGSVHRDPFCRECGKLSPRVTCEGPLALEILEVPSEKVRTLLVEALCQWFPEIDRFHAYDRFRKGPSILISGIDTESANRLLKALQDMNVDGGLRTDIQESGIGLLWNAGLAVSGGLLILAFLWGGFLGLLFFLGALGAPFVGAAARRKRNIPLISRPGLIPDAERWGRLSAHYSAVIKNLGPEDAASLRMLTARVFDLQRRLRSGSLAALAAGGEAGSLYKRLREAIETAVDLSGTMASSKGQSSEDLRREFAELVGMVNKTSEWYIALETGNTKQPAELNHELQDIASGIERIIQDVRSPLEPGLMTGRKERL
jgi:hypothetical protein